VIVHINIVNYFEFKITNDKYFEYFTACYIARIFNFHVGLNSSSIKYHKMGYYSDVGSIKDNKFMIFNASYILCVSSQRFNPYHDLVHQGFIGDLDCLACHSFA
jgi:hypothetical protein